jgi:hypothetical protein
MLIQHCAKGMLLDVHRCLVYNQGSIDEIIQEINEETKCNKNRNTNEIIEHSATIVVREMQEEKWLSNMIRTNVELSHEVKKIKERWEKLIKKIKDKKESKNNVFEKRELKRKETKEREKKRLIEIMNKISDRIVELSYRKLKIGIWIDVESICEQHKEVINKKIQELIDIKASGVSESINSIISKIDNNRLSEIKVNEMVKSISEKISMKLENNNWYCRLVKGWETRKKTERELKLRYRGLSRMKNKRRHKKDEKKDKRKDEDERKKRNWHIIRDGKLPGVKLIKDTSKEQVLLYLAKTYYVD